jgi:Transglutaminase-like superfamily
MPPFLLSFHFSFLAALSRRTVFFIIMISAPSMASVNVQHAEFLAPTAFIDSAYPLIVSTTNRVTVGASDAREKAVRIHDFVRDEVLFGWTSAFYAQKASDVLAAKVGYCNTKSTLFVAMLRAAGVPARQVFVDINAAILAGFIDPGMAYVDHSYAEVYLDGKWIRVDSYIVDQPLAVKARRALAGEKRALGYGVHRDGTSTWNGRDDAFSQFLNDGKVPTLSTKQYGAYADVGAFYESGNGVNKLNPMTRLLFGFFSRSANQRVEAFRREAK